MFSNERVFMPVPQQLGRGRRMGRGPYEKSGLVEDTSLPPLRTVTSTYEIFFPVKEEEVEGEAIRSFPSRRIEVEVKLWYLPYGTMEDDAVLWREYRKTVAIEIEEE